MTVILATVIDGALRIYTRSDKGAIDQVGQLQGARDDPNLVVTMVSDLATQFDWLPKPAPKAPAPLPKPKRKSPLVGPRTSYTAEERAAQEGAVVEVLRSEGPSTIGGIAAGSGLERKMLSNRIQTLLAQGLITRQQDAHHDQRFVYSLVEGVSDGVRDEDLRESGRPPGSGDVPADV